MAQKDESNDVNVKLLAVQLFALGASQDTIARIAKRRKQWVVNLLKGVPKPKK
jgi:hypothetical protein